MVGLVDCNNFFVSCERSVNHSLEGKAVVVMSNNDGCAIARSNEAKALGVKMGQPIFELKNLINSGQLIALSGNHSLYHSISSRLHRIFRDFSPVVTDYSIDEAFLDMTGIPETALIEIGKNICTECWQEARIPVTVGFSHTKTLAKIATNIGKKREQSIILLNDKMEIDEILRRIAINDVWGIGRRTAKRLYFNGVTTAFEYTQKDATWIIKEFGVNGLRTYNELCGISCIDLSSCHRVCQDSISETRTFAKDTSDYDFIKSRITLYASHCATKLRNMNACCKSITVFLMTNRFNNEHEMYSPNIQLGFQSPTNSLTTIICAAESGLNKIYSSVVKYKRAGVILSDIKSETIKQLSLFNDVNRKESDSVSKLMQTIDKINKSTYNTSLRLASQIGIGQDPKDEGLSTSFGFKGIK